jgi:electron transport complex protein RnfG
VLETKETPGLGTKIETDPGFLKNFEKLDVALNDAMTALAHPIEAVKKGEKEHPWQIDAITGATISSNAIASILGRSTEHWIPKIRGNLDDLRKAE